LKSPIAQNLKKEFARLTPKRNDLNHAGYLPHAKEPDCFKRNIHQIFREVMQYFAAHPVKKPFS